MVLNGLVEDLQDMKWTIGKEFQVVNVSINPNETPTLAAAKKRTYLKRYSRATAAQGWHFLTGDQVSSKLLADQVGFQFAYDEISKQYAHPSGIVVLTPEGKVARYFFGVKFAPDDLYASVLPLTRLREYCQGRGINFFSVSSNTDLQELLLKQLRQAEVWG